RIRYLGVILYDADRIKEAASTASEQDLYEQQLGVFLNPHDADVIKAARAEGIPDSWLEYAQRSPVYKMAMEWKIAFPLHPEYRTLPMVWYIPPLSPVQSAADAGNLGQDGLIPDVKSLRIPVKYLANMLTAGDERPVVSALERMLAMRQFKRSQTVEGKPDHAVLEQVGLDEHVVEDMYRIMAIANYEDRFVIPTAHKELSDDPFGERNGCGFSFGDGCNVTSNGATATDLFGGKPASRRKFPVPVKIEFKHPEKESQS
ncbi:MAG TPA: nitrate reductase subunit beta, partial [Gammaproteobacteria bacterium]|nr:nitrate reductase subunit beta [Gammaproteobacteria bacterium]